MGADRPRQTARRERQIRLQRGFRMIGASLQPQRLRNAAAGNSGKQPGNLIARRLLHLARMIDGRQTETLDQIGCERQQVRGLVGVRNQIDDKLDIPAQRGGVVFALREQRQRIGVEECVLKKIFGRRIAAERRVQRQHAKFRRLPQSWPPDQRLDPCGFRIGRLGGLVVAGGLPERTDPVEALGILRIEGDGLLKTRDRGLDLTHLVERLAEQVMDPAIFAGARSSARSGWPWPRDIAGPPSAHEPCWRGPPNGGD